MLSISSHKFLYIFFSVNIFLRMFSEVDRYEMTLPYRMPNILCAYARIRWMRRNFRFFFALFLVFWALFFSSSSVLCYFAQFDHQYSKIMSHKISKYRRSHGELNIFLLFVNSVRHAHAMHTHTLIDSRRFIHSKCEDKQKKIYVEINR